MTETNALPNHHAHYPGFSGFAGLVAALSMSVSRNGDARLVARLSRLEPGDVVVDIGSGPGAAVRHAARVGADATGVEPASIMLRVARLLTRATTHVRYLEGTAEAIPVADESATVVWSIASVHHWTDLDAGLRETFRVLKPAGRLVTIERHSPPAAHGLASHGWTDSQADAFAVLCRAHGYIDTEVEHATNGNRSTICVTATKP